VCELGGTPSGHERKGKTAREGEGKKVFQLQVERGVSLSRQSRGCGDPRGPQKYTLYTRFIRRSSVRILERRNLKTGSDDVMYSEKEVIASYAIVEGALSFGASN